MNSFYGKTSFLSRIFFTTAWASAKCRLTVSCQASGVRTAKRHHPAARRSLPACVLGASRCGRGGERTIPFPPALEQAASAGAGRRKGSSMTVLCNKLLRARQNPPMTSTCCPAPVILGGKIPDRIFCCRPAFAPFRGKGSIRLSRHDIFPVLRAESFQEADVSSGHRYHPVTGADF